MTWQEVLRQKRLKKRTEWLLREESQAPIRSDFYRAWWEERLRRKRRGLQ